MPTSPFISLKMMLFQIYFLKEIRFCGSHFDQRWKIFSSEASEGEMDTKFDSFTLDSNSSYVDVGQVVRSIVKYEYCW